MTPTFERWVNWIALVATLVMFADFVVSFHEHHAELDWAIAAFGALLLVGVFLMRIFRVTTFVRDVYTKFLVHDNRKVWATVKHRYRYVGVSGATFLSEFRLFVETHPKELNGVVVEFLLLYPDRELVRQSKIHETGQEDFQDGAIEAVQRTIEDTARLYSSLRSSGVNIEVRLYKEFCRYWAHLVDDGDVYVAPLLYRQSGLQSVVLKLAGGPARNLLARYYFEEFDRLWRSALPVESLGYAASEAPNTMREGAHSGKSG